MLDEPITGAKMGYRLGPNIPEGFQENTRPAVSKSHQIGSRPGWGSWLSTRNFHADKRTA